MQKEQFSRYHDVQSFFSCDIYFKLGLILPDRFLFSKFRRSLCINSNSFFEFHKIKKISKD